MPLASQMHGKFKFTVCHLLWWQRALYETSFEISFHYWRTFLMEMYNFRVSILQNRFVVSFVYITALHCCKLELSGNWMKTKDVKFLPVVKQYFPLKDFRQSLYHIITQFSALYLSVTMCFFIALWLYTRCSILWIVETVD